MKSSTVLLYLFLFLSLHIQAQVQEQKQEENDYVSGELFPKKGDVGVSILMDGLIDNFQFSSVANSIGENVLFAKYYLEDDLALRLGFGFSLLAANRQTADSVAQTLVETDSSASSYLINVAFGIERHLRPTKRLDPFIFAQVDLTFIGKTNVEIENNTTSVAGTETERRTIKADGGIAFSLQAGGGLNYFLTERFSIGSELAIGLQVINQGGTVSDNQTITPINGNSTSNVVVSKDQLTNTIISVTPNALLNLSYFF